MSSEISARSDCGLIRPRILWHAAMDPDKNPKLVNSKELALLLGVKEGWIRRNMEKIPHLKLGRLVRFDPQKVREQFEARGFSELT